MRIRDIFCIATLAAAHIFAGELRAADSDLLDALVKNATLTRAEADALKKDRSTVSILRPETKKLRIGGRMQLQYEWANSEVFAGAGSPQKGNGSNNFLLRRVFVEAFANLGGGWDAQVGLDLARSRLNSYFVDTYLSKSLDYEYLSGRLCLGYMKPGFCYEDMLSSFSLDAIERSAATSYFTLSPNGRRLGIGNRYAGVRWNGKVKQVEGLSYTLAVTNSFQLSPVHEDELEYNWSENRLAYWASVHYERKFENAKLKFGVYTMYSATANKQMGEAPAASVYSVNPYIAGRVGNLYFWTEYMASVVADGRSVAGGGYEQASPYGVNFSIEYRFDIGEQGQLGPTFRYSWLDTDGRGLQMSDAVRNAGNVGGLYDTANDFYAGLNWYIMGDDLKVQLGYGYTQFSGWAGENSGRAGSHVGETHSVRLQMQMKF